MTTRLKGALISAVLVAAFIGQTQVAMAQQGRIENPAEGSTQSGIGLISGWRCDADVLEIEFEDGSRSIAAYGTARGDTESACGDSDNGFGLLYNFNLLGTGEHTIKALADGEVFRETTFNVLRPSTGEFATGLEAEVVVQDFPQPGHSVTLEWSQGQQNFNIIAEAEPQQVESGVVFEYGQVAPQWTGGIKGFDEGIDYNECVESSGCPNMDWAIVDDEERGEVLEVQHTGSGFAGIYIQAFDPGLDMTEYAAGTVNFDIKVVEGGSSTGFTMKIDCIYPCGSAEQSLGRVGFGGWETVSVPISDLTSSGLQLETVTTGLTIFPNSGRQTGMIYRLDNIYWEK